MHGHESLCLGRTRATLAMLAGIVAVLAACEAKEPTAADVDALSGASAERAARQLGVLHPVDTGVAYKVNGARVTAEEARAVPASEIASMYIGRDSGSEHAVDDHNQGQDHAPAEASRGRQRSRRDDELTRGCGTRRRTRSGEQGVGRYRDRLVRERCSGPNMRRSARSIATTSRASTS